MINRIIHLIALGWRSAFESAADGGNLSMGLSLFPRDPWREMLYRSSLYFSDYPDLDAPEIAVIGWIIRSFSSFLSSPWLSFSESELRRALAELGRASHFSLSGEKREMVDDLAEAVTQSPANNSAPCSRYQRDTSTAFTRKQAFNSKPILVESLTHYFHPKTGSYTMV